MKFLSDLGWVLLNNELFKHVKFGKGTHKNVTVITNPTKFVSQKNCNMVTERNSEIKFSKVNVDRITLKHIFFV